MRIDNKLRIMDVDQGTLFSDERTVCSRSVKERIISLLGRNLKATTNILMRKMSLTEEAGGNLWMTIALFVCSLLRFGC